MCSTYEALAMTGLTEDHVSILQQASPENAQLVQELFDAINMSLRPHLPVLPGLIAAVEAVQNNDYGILSQNQLVRLPLSIVGVNGTRYPTQTVSWLHDSFLPFNMSQYTVSEVRKTLQKHGLCILFLCSCGVVIGKCQYVSGYYGSPDHTRMDRLRSAVDSTGKPIQPVDDFSEIPVKTMDLHQNGAEERLYNRIEELLYLLTVTPATADSLWIENELAYFASKANPIPSNFVMG